MGKYPNCVKCNMEYPVVKDKNGGVKEDKLCRICQLCPTCLGKGCSTCNKWGTVFIRGS